MKTSVPSEWILTDEDTCRYSRQLSEDSFELIAFVTYSQVRNFTVYADTVCLTDYPQDETLFILQFYGYSSINEVTAEHGSDSNMIIAECIFEHYADFAVEPIADVLTEAEARAIIQDYITDTKGAPLCPDSSKASG